MFNFLSQKLSSIFDSITGKNKLSERTIGETMARIEEALLESDVPYPIVTELIAQIKAEVIGQKVFESLKPGEHLIKIFHDRVCAFMGGENATVPVSFQIPSVVMVMGLQGSGKTTTCAKIVHFINEQARARGKKRDILLASVDFYRPAAVDQLEILAQQVGAQWYRSSETDPVRAAHDIYAYFKKSGFELLILDTAGRLHIDSAMLDELRAIDAALKPKYKILVLDAMTGQESLTVAQAFEEGVGFGAAVLTKMDSETRAGAVIAFRYKLHKPIMLLGTGEKVDEIEQFYPDRVAKRILGMGDLESLLDQAQAKIDQAESEKAARSLAKGRFTLDDFAQQMNMMAKLGSMAQIARYLPAGLGAQLTPEILQKGETDMKRFKAIISSMTPKERSCPQLLDGSRKDRVARGAGVTVQAVNDLLKRFEESQQFVKMMKKSGRFPNMFG